MNKKKLIFDNFLVYGLGQITYKIIPFLMLPVLTRIMPDSSYYIGINDLLNTLVSLMAVLGLMGMYDAMFRLYFDCDKLEEDSQKKICSTALAIVVFFSSIVCIMMIIFRKSIAAIFFTDINLSYMVIFGSALVVVDNLCNVISTPTRIKNKRGIFIAANIVRAAALYLTAIFLVWKSHYMLAMPLGNLASAIIYIIFFMLVNHDYFSIKDVSKAKILPLLRIGLPLFPTFIVFWIYSSVDRLMIVQMIGVSANGIYSVANKIALVSQLITSAFAMGWSYFNFKTMNDPSHARDFSMITEYLCMAGLAGFLIFRISGLPIIDLLFPDNYLYAGKILPYLFLVPVVNLTFQLIGSQFLILKKTIYTTIISSMGIGLNIALNYLLITKFSIIGASYATLISYIFITIIGFTVLARRNLFYFNWHFVLLAVLFSSIMLGDMLKISEFLMAVLVVMGICVLLLSYIKSIVENLLSIGGKMNEKL